MTPAEVAAMCPIRAEYSAPVLYTGAGLAAETVTAIRSNVDASLYQGVDGAPARVTFEIGRGQLPEDPRRGNTIVEGDGAAWSVIDTDFQPAIDSWVLSVEEVTT